MEGARERQRDDWRRAAWTAWHQAAFARSKKIPDLKKLLSAFDSRRSESLTPDQLRELLEQMGGVTDG